MDWSTNLQMVTAGLAMGSIYALVALGFVLIFNAVNVVNFAQGEFAMVPAFVAVWLLTRLNIPFALTCVITVAFMAVFGIVFQRIAYYPLRNRSFLPVIISTIGVGIFLKNGAQIIFGAEPLSMPRPTSANCGEPAWSVRRPPVHRDHRLHAGPARLPVLLLREDSAGQEDAGHGAGQGDGAASGHPGGNDDRHHLCLQFDPRGGGRDPGRAHFLRDQGDGRR